jgi:predicted helicase
VIIGNPPYNSHQFDESHNNKNRAYTVIDRRINETYAVTSTATLTNKLYDPYVKFWSFRHHSGYSSSPPQWK